MKHNIKNIGYYTAFTLVVWVSVFLFWHGMPELMSYHEQYQLFLFTADYFNARLAMVGGIADYISEFLVQFYYVPWMGATAIATLMALIQMVLGALLVSKSNSKYANQCLYMLAVIPVIGLLYFMGDENVLLSYPTAVLIVLVIVLIVSKLQFYRSIWVAILLLIAFIVGYWMAGPTALLIVIITPILKPGLSKRWLWMLCGLVVACVLIFLIVRTVFVQYPESWFYLGLNYYRIPNIHSLAIYVIPSLIIALTLLSKLDGRRWGKTLVPLTVGVVIGLSFCAKKGYDDAKMEIFRYDYLVRNARWYDIIQLSDRKAPSSDFALQAVNLALGKTGILWESMFEYPQHGIGSLLAKYEVNNTSCLVTAETFYHLGMVNSALRYNFDLQEAIMNDQKSGRFMKRIADCQIINGKYKAASKYINMLKHSLFYRDWAINAENSLYDEEKINQNPDWREKRQLRFKQEMLYDYNEIEKMLGLLAIESQGQNLLAWDYFNAALLLKGDIQTLGGMYHYADEFFHISQMPKHIQEAIAMYWTFGHPNFDGIPFAISDEVKAKIAAIAQAAQRNPNPTVLANQFPGVYCIYFLKKQAQGANAMQQDRANGSARGD